MPLPLTPQAWSIATTTTPPTITPVVSITGKRGASMTLCYPLPIHLAAARAALEHMPAPTPATPIPTIDINAMDTHRADPTVITIPNCTPPLVHAVQSHEQHQRARAARLPFILWSRARALLTSLWTSLMSLLRATPADDAAFLTTHRYLFCACYRIARATLPAFAPPLLAAAVIVALHAAARLKLHAANRRLLRAVRAEVAALPAAKRAVLQRVVLRQTGRGGVAERIVERGMGRGMEGVRREIRGMLEAEAAEAEVEAEGEVDVDGEVVGERAMRWTRYPMRRAGGRSNAKEEEGAWL